MTAWDTAWKILAATRRIALVGASENPARDSHRVMRYLLAEGFEVDPVNPHAHTVCGRPCAPELAALAHPIDTVVCFRRNEHMETIARSAVGIAARHLWMQIGVVHDPARQVAQNAGLLVVMDRCILVEHRRMRNALDVTASLR